MAHFEIRNLNFAYPQSEFKALSGINLTLQEGSFTLLIGKSGSGKSTLLRHLKPQFTPHGARSGEVLFCGKDVFELDTKHAAQSIGYVLQNPIEQIVCDKVYSELALGLECIGISPDKMRIRLAETCAFFGLDEVFRRDTDTLSGGQKQLLVLASVVAMRPKAIILDEPTSQLDPVAAAEFFSLLGRINQNFGTTVIVSEHRTEEAFSFCDNVIVMDNGRIIACGKPAAVCSLGTRDASGRSNLTPMFPAATRLTAGLKEEGAYPITVKEGRAYLKNILKTENNLQTEAEKNHVQTDAKITNSNIAVKLKDVFFSYEKSSREVLRGVSFCAEAGKVYSVLGSNGSGKTTLLKVIGGVRKPYAGSVEIFKKKISAYKNGELYKNNIAMLPQNPNLLFMHKTVREELLDIEKDDAKIQKTVERFKLESLLNSHPGDLSAGECKRAALAKILLTKPKILLLDEPTVGIDPYFKKVLCEIIKELAKKELCIICATHDTEFAASVSDMCGIFFDGSISEPKTPHEFFPDNFYYTTAVDRMARAVGINALTVEELLQKIQKRLKND